MLQAHAMVICCLDYFHEKMRTQIVVLTVVTIAVAFGAAVIPVMADDNTLNDLTEIQVVIHNKTYTSANSVVDMVTYKWTPGGGWAELDRQGGTNTWEFVADCCIVPSDLTTLSSTWNVKFMPGKVARALASGHFALNTATDASGSGDNTLADITMERYGEITANDGSFSSGDIDLGATDQAITTPTNGRIQFDTIVNGNYKLQSKTVNWTNTTHSETITLDTDGGSLASGHFALKNYGANSVGSANNVGTSDVTIAGKSNVVSNLSETGNNVDIYAWLSSVTKGIMPYDYRGTYTVTISNS